jgi:hypothetical protein
MSLDFTTSYAAIIKQEKQEDGTLMVYGKATDDSLDLDNQICDPAWLDTAMPQWFKSGGNIREQHSNIAAGVAKELESKADGHYISAHVVDPVSVKKVEAGVLKGFSIGIKAPRVVRDSKAANGRIIDGQIIEVSLVDRPANPNAKLIMAKSVDGEPTLVQTEELHEYKAPLPSDIAKRDVPAKERERLAARGAAMPDGSYPIANVSDLKNAIQAFGRAKNPAKVKQHIIRRARALGAIDQLPEGWNVKKADDLVTAVKALDADTAKFDQATFDNARRALAQLIIVEANEMAEDGHNEKDSIEALLDAVKHLFEWYEGEMAEGEVAGAEMIHMSTDAEIAKDEHCDCDGCAACKTNGGCDKSPCEKCMMAKSETADKCLECGCHKPADDHGRSDVSTAEMVSPDQSPKSAEADETPAADDAAETEVSKPEEAGEDLPVSDVETVIELAVKSAMKSVESEIAKLRADKETAVTKAVALEQDLATAMSKAASGGPKRAARPAGTESNDLLVKAAAYKAKAAAATDHQLAEGYREIAADLLKKAGKIESESNDN